jgi:hypothetical protein
MYPPESGLQSPSASPLKRRRSEDPEDLGEKRQRVASISGADDDIGLIFAQAAAAAAQQIEESSSGAALIDNGAGQDGARDKPAGDGGGHLLTRVLSLPMLESLVS